MRLLIAASATTALCGVLALTAHTSAVTASAQQPALGPNETGQHRLAAPARSGIAHLSGVADLQQTASGTWTNTGLRVTLTRPGTYALDADVRARLSGVPQVNTFIVARLWNVTADAALPDSERICNQIIDSNAGDALTGQNTTVPISERVTVTGPTIIELQAERVNAAGASAVASIYSDANGRTSLRYDQVAP
jgi:hypothetical protein